MAFKGRKNTSQNNIEELAEPNPQGQEVIEEPPELLQENNPPVILIKFLAAPKSTTPEGI